MNTAIIRQIFQSKFDYQTYCNEIVHNIFGCNDIAIRPELLDATADGDECNFIGRMTDADGRELGFFYTRVASGSDVRRKRVGLRKMIAPYLKYDVDAAIAVFADENHWRLSYICDMKEGVTNAKRFSYVLGEEQGQYKTPLERLDNIYAKRGRYVLNDLRDAFSVDALSNEFFKDYHFHYDRIVDELARQGKSGATYHDYVKKMLGRIVFLHFLQKKGWLDGNLYFLRDMFFFSPHQADFLDQVLEPLFFGIFNTEQNKRVALFKERKWDTELLKQWQSLPYLNGGLFEEDAIDRMRISLPAKLFEELFRYLASYNFTVDENDPDDAEIGVDPEMLGKIFESLLEDNKAKGAFYTPKEIVRYMCKESLIAYLSSKLPDVKDSIVRAFVESHEMQPELEPSRDTLDQALRDVKICDPAIGSGAFPMGLLNELWRCREALEPTGSRVALKKEIIENNIYGVDIERGAIDIARLRFWLSIVVDSEQPEALPNFDYKFMQGNSLIESYQGCDLSRIAGKTVGRPSTSTQLVIGLDSDLSRKNLQRLLHEYFSVTDHQQKANMRQAINDEVKTLIRESLGGTTASIAKLNALDPSANQEFFLWHTWLKDIFDNGGFDIIIANPPYVKEYTNRAAFDGFRETSPYYMGKMDIWYGFACHGLDMLKKNGVLCFIAQNNWTTSAGAKKMRNKVTKESQILQMLDFNTYMVFENAGIQTMIMLFMKNSKIDDYPIDYRIITSGTDKNDMLALLSKKSGNTRYMQPIINREKYYDSLLTFSDNESIFDKIAIGKVYLEDNEVAQGIVFPQDFLNKKGAQQLYNRYPVGTGIFGLSDSEKKQLNLTKKEMDLIRPYYTTEQIHRYYTDCRNTLWLIYTDSSFKNATKMNEYPNLKTHLDKFKSIFTSDNRPYGLHRCRNQRFFQGEKVISLRKCVGQPCFSYSDFDCYVTQTFFSIQSSRWNMKFLTGVLNSTLVAFWLRSKGKMQGSNYQVDKEPLQGIPLPIVDISQQKPIIALVDQILSVKKSNPQSDTSALEHKIDELVYGLYGLNKEDITVIESS